MLTFDIETKPLDEDRLRELCPPFDGSDFVDPGEFDPASVKLGNIKDPEKIREKIEAKRAEHDQLRSTLSQRRELAHTAHFADFAKRSGLSPATSRVLVIGVYSAPKDRFMYLPADSVDDEATSISRFWSMVLQMADARRRVVGHNIFDFDLPYLVNRSWILGLEVPQVIYSLRGRWVNWHDCFFDTRKAWLLGRSNDEKSSHDHIGRVLGTGGKCVDGVDGSSFWKVWQDDQPRALEYLKQDVVQPAKWALAMGVR